MKIADIDVEYIDHMGSDLSVCNAARVSFGKETEWDFEPAADMTYDKVLKPADKKLIKYLAEHKHWSPFSHTSVSFRVKAPIFVARQLVKHQVGFSWNEVSRRYVQDEPEFFMPDGWRAKADNVKQGSSSDIVDSSDIIDAHVDSATRLCLDLYNDMLKKGVCAEQARMVLPQNTMTEWIWTGSLYGWARMCELRLDSHTQLETREVAKQVAKTMKSLFPVSWDALMYANKPKEKVCALLSSTLM